MLSEPGAEIRTEVADEVSSVTVLRGEDVLTCGGLSPVVPAGKRAVKGGRCATTRGALYAVGEAAWELGRATSTARPWELLRERVLSTAWAAITWCSAEETPTRPDTLR